MNATVSILLRLFLRRQLDNELSMKNNFLRLLIKGCQPSPASDTTIDSFEALLTALLTALKAYFSVCSSFRRRTVLANFCRQPVFSKDHPRIGVLSIVLQIIEENRENPDPENSMVLSDLAVSRRWVD